VFPPALPFQPPQSAIPGNRSCQHNRTSRESSFPHLCRDGPKQLSAVPHGGLANFAASLSVFRGGSSLCICSVGSRLLTLPAYRRFTQREYYRRAHRPTQRKTSLGSLSHGWFAQQSRPAQYCSLLVYLLTRIGILTPCNYGVLPNNSTVKLGATVCDQYIALVWVTANSSRFVVSTRRRFILPAKAFAARN
jgi:hypothetical protein